MHAQPGDEIVVDINQLGIGPRRGTVAEVRGEAGHEHYLVRWGDGHESIFYPRSSARIIHQPKATA